MTKEKITIKGVEHEETLEHNECKYHVRASDGSMNKCFKEVKPKPKFPIVFEENNHRFEVSERGNVTFIQISGTTNWTWTESYSLNAGIKAFEKAKEIRDGA